MADANGVPIGTVIPLPERGGELRIEHRYGSPSHDVLIGLYRNGERIRDLTLYEEEFVASAWVAASPPKMDFREAILEHLRQLASGQDLLASCDVLRILDNAPKVGDR